MRNLAHQNTRGLLLVDTAAGKDESVVKILNRAKHYSDKAQSMMNDRENIESIHSMVSSITTYAMLNSDVLHIDVKYTACIEEIEVKVFDGKTDYSTAHSRKFSCAVYLDNHNALNTLKALEDKLIDLVAEAKDKAMGAC